MLRGTAIAVEAQEYDYVTQLVIDFFPARYQVTIGDLHGFETTLVVTESQKYYLLIGESDVFHPLGL